MDAKRLVPVLHILEGRIVDPETGSDLGQASTWARRLEMEGADEILFTERGKGRRLRQGWMAEVARALFIPFALEAPFADEAEVAEALADGADKVVVPTLALARACVGRFGRTRVSVALEGMADLDRAEAGEILLNAGGEDLAELCARAAHLPLPVILRCADPAQAVEALAHGADGIAFPAALRTASDFKALLGPAGVPLRH